MKHLADIVALTGEPGHGNIKTRNTSDPALFFQAELLACLGGHSPINTLEENTIGQVAHILQTSFDLSGHGDFVF